MRGRGARGDRGDDPAAARPSGHVTRLVHAARWVSILAHPFVMIALLVTVAGWRFAPETQVFRSVLAVTIAVVVPVAILMLVQVRHGRWSNVDASNPEERGVLFIVALAALAALLTWLLLKDPRSFLVRGVIVTAILLAVVAVLTRWIKLSLHLAFAGMAAMALTLIGSRVGFALIGVVPLLCWSRLALSRHRPVELAFGLALGVLAGVALVV